MFGSSVVDVNDGEVQYKVCTTYFTRINVLYGSHVIYKVPNQGKNYRMFHPTLQSVSLHLLSPIVYDQQKTSQISMLLVPLL